MFWFLALVVVLIILILQQSSSKEEDNSHYLRGRNDERQALAAKINEVTKNNKSQEISLVVLRDIFKNPIKHPIKDDPSKNVSATVMNSNYEASGAEAPLSSPPLTSQQEKEDNEKQSIKNLNILLYVGSFLIVAATALFVTLTMPPMIRLAGMVVVTSAFYVGGLILYKRSERLRSAATAFVGTGLAILPFVGVALSSLVGVAPEISWLIISLIGVVAFATAATILQNEFISYATMAFVVSLALSFVPTMQLSVMWYFIALILVSTIMNLGNLLWPKRIPPIFAKSIQTSGTIMTPVALISSLLTSSSMNLWMYEILFGLATLHYLVLWGVKHTRIYEYLVRSLFTITTLLIGIDLIDFPTRGASTGLSLGLDNLGIGQRMAAIGVVWLIIALAQVVYSLLRAKSSSDKNIKIEQSIVVFLLMSIVFSMVMFAGSENWQAWVSLDMAAIGVACVSAAFRWRNVNWLYGSLVASVFLPFLIARGVMSPVLDFEVIAVVFAIAGVLSLILLERMIAAKRSKTVSDFFLSATIIYSLAIAISGILAAKGVDVGLAFMISAILVILASLISNQIKIEIIGVVYGVISIAGWTNELLPNSEWKGFIVVLFSTILLLMGAMAHQHFSQSKRRDLLVISAITMLFGLLFVISNRSKEVVATGLVVLLLGSVVCLAIRGFNKDKLSESVKMATIVGYVGYSVLALVAGFELGAGWLPMTLLALAGIYWASSMIEREPRILPVGHLFFWFAIMAFWSWQQYSQEWFIYGTSWISAAVYYLWYWFDSSQKKKEISDISLVFTLVALLLPAFSGLFIALDNKFIVASAISIILIAAVMAIEGYIRKQKNYIEAAVYAATLGLQRLLYVALPELSEVAYAQWWALIIFATAIWRKDLKNRLVIALLFITIPTGLFALTKGDGYIWLFLVEHLIMAITGAVYRKQWVMWWGIVAVVLAILYFIREYTALMLLLLGFLLIAFVVWRLMRGKNDAH